jgi:Fe-S-cluster containining protein
MSFSNRASVPSDSTGGESPATWNVESLHRNWIETLQATARKENLSIPAKRLQIQSEQASVYQEVSRRWLQMDGTTKIQSWKRLLEAAEGIAQDVLPTCVECGECCRQGSPSLHLEDLELLQDGKIPWNQLFTLRQGEPVHSPYEDKLFFLLDERIKVLEKPGRRECVFLEEDSDQCLIYSMRPLQCRAQACWDPTTAEQLAQQPYLTRRDIFANLELLLDLMTEHDRRCSFGNLSALFKKMEESDEDQNKIMDEIVSMVAYEDHFRQSMAEQLKIPQDVVDLVFGRSFVDLMPLFGFRVKTEDDGKRCLVRDDS